ncbi:MAG TPA: hypothetical protein VHW43_09555 [Puia sp.]|jgi:hypothetical protein|nr:hypothetical protein [Puia sp.]
MKLISCIRKTISLSFLTVIFGGISLVTLANGNEPTPDRSAATAEVKYIAAKNGDGLFNVIYNNASGSRFSVAVLDEYGNRLYQGYFTDRVFNRKFKLADPESTSKIIFVIRNFGDNSVQRFQVDATSELVEDVQVKEVR